MLTVIMPKPLVTIIVLRIDRPSTEEFDGIRRSQYEVLDVISRGSWPELL